MIFILCELEKYGEHIAKGADLEPLAKNQYKTKSGETVIIITNIESLKGFRKSKVLFARDIKRSRDIDYYKDVVLSLGNKIIHEIEN